MDETTTLRKALHKRIGIALILLFAAVQAAHAQTTGTISGVVTDQVGALLPNVQVSARNTASGELPTAVTNKAGEYSFLLLQTSDLCSHL